MTICPICQSSTADKKEWKHCCKDKVLVCADCCALCTFYNNEIWIGGRMCTWEETKYTWQELREMNILNNRIKKTMNVLKTQQKLGWPTEDTEAQLKYLQKRLAEMKGE